MTSQEQCIKVDFSPRCWNEEVGPLHFSTYNPGKIREIVKREIKRAKKGPDIGINGLSTDMEPLPEL